MRDRLAHIEALLAFFLARESSVMEKKEKKKKESARGTSRKLALFIRDFLDRRRERTIGTAVSNGCSLRGEGGGEWDRRGCGGGDGNDGGAGEGRKKGARRGCGSTRSTHSRPDEKAASNRHREKRRELL